MLTLFCGREGGDKKLGSSSKEHAAQSTSLNAVPFSPFHLLSTVIQRSGKCCQLDNCLIPMRLVIRQYTSRSVATEKLVFMGSTLISHHFSERITPLLFCIPDSTCVYFISRSQNLIQIPSRNSWENMVLCLPRPCDPEGSIEKGGNRS